MEAHQDSDNCGTDSQSVSSMEFGTVEGGTRLEGGVSASKSLDSLDLRTGEGEEEGELCYSLIIQSVNIRCITYFLFPFFLHSEL